METNINQEARERGWMKNKKYEKMKSLQPISLSQ
jgi:hypothetical protein